jgi:hypothetical protein
VNCLQPLKESLKEQDFFDIMSLPGRVEDAALVSSGTDYKNTADLASTDLAAAAENYLIAHGMDAAKLAALKEKLR